MDALDELYRQPIPLAGAAAGTPGGSKLWATWTLARRLLGKGLMGRIIFGCMCSILVSVVTNLPYLKMAVLWFCQGIIWIFGKPELPPPIKERVEVIVARGKEAAGRHEIAIPPIVGPASPAEPTPAKAGAGPKADARPHTLREAAARVEHKVQARLADTAAAKVKETVREAKQEVHEKAEQLTDTVKVEARKIGGRMEMAAAAIGQQGQRLSDRRAEALRQAAERQAEAERQAILQKAVRYKIPWKDRPIEQVRDEVAAAEAEHAPNAQCPACRYPLRLPPEADGRRRCPRCRRSYSVTAALTLGPPRSAPALFRPFSMRPTFR